MIELLGWAGSLIMLLAYALLSMRRLRAESTAYQAMNVAGAAGMAANSVMHRAFPSAFASLIWAAVGAFTLVRLLGRSSD